MLISLSADWAKSLLPGKTDLIVGGAGGIGKVTTDGPGGADEPPKLKLLPVDRILLVPKLKFVHRCT